MAFLPVDEQLELISRGTEEVIPLNDLRKKLEKSISDNKPLTAKKLSLKRSMVEELPLKMTSRQQRKFQVKF